MFAKVVRRPSWWAASVLIAGLVLAPLQGAGAASRPKAHLNGVTSAPTSISTTVYNASTNSPWSGSQTGEVLVYDTSVVSGETDSTVPTGSVTYSYFTNGGCFDGPASVDTVNLNSGVAPHSLVVGPLPTGSYSFEAAYSGDSNYAGSTSSCESFSVGAVTSSPTSISTTVYDASSDTPWSGAEPSQDSAYDTATVSGEVNGNPPTGAVIYSFFTNGNCFGSPASFDTVTLSAGAVPNSYNEGPLDPGTYSFEAAYSGDSNYVASTSACEAFSVASATGKTASISTIVWDDTTNTEWSGNEPPESSAYDTAVVSGEVDGIVPTGTVTYSFFGNGTCAGGASAIDTVTLSSSGAVPDSSVEGPLASGSYSFEALYSGDSNYGGSPSSCEPFSVGTTTTSPTSVSTSVFDASTNTAWKGTETAGASAFDTATVSGEVDGKIPTGTVTYRYFENATCAAGASSTNTVTLNAAGTVPDSPTQGPLPTGSYSFEASYSGDSTYSSSTSTCEPFSVVVPTGPVASVSTTVYDASTNAPWSGSESSGASAYDTATLSGEVDGTAPTGTVTYSFFTNGSCANSSGSTDTVTISAGAVPNSMTEGPLAEGSYSFEAAYSGDSKYGGSTSPCEPFSTGSGTRGSKVELYVTPAVDGGSDPGNICTLESRPCATIAHAIAEEASLAPGSIGSVINLAKGTFNDPNDTMFAGLSPSNDNVTIVGKGKKTLVEPQGCSSLGTAVSPSPDSGDQALVVFNGGVDGITIEDMTLNGSFVAGGGCPDYEAGVIDTSGTTGDAVVGDTISSGATYGILTDYDANSTIISDNLTPVLCSGTVKGPNKGLNQGWTSPADLKVNKIPSCAKAVESGHGAFTGVFINGIAYCATAASNNKALVLSGTPGPGGCPNSIPITASGGVAIANGATVLYNTSVPPFTQWGIACNSPVGGVEPATDCAISDNTVTAGGWVYGDYEGPGAPANVSGSTTCSASLFDGPVGIVVTGQATADVDGNSVSNMSDDISECPEPGESTDDAIGIGLVPDTSGDSAGSTIVGIDESVNPPTGNGNSLGSSGADGTGIVVHGGTLGSSNGSSTYEVDGNNVTNAANAGIELADLGYGYGSLRGAFEVNTVSGVTLGPGMELDGVKGQTIGGVLGTEGNSSTTNAMGLVLGPCGGGGSNPPYDQICNAVASPNSALASTDNTIVNNQLTANVAYGLLDVGNYQPVEVAAPVGGCSQVASCGNTFDNNTWTGNGTMPSELNGANVLDGTGWGGGCQQVAGDCVNGPSLTFEGTDTTFSSSSPGSTTFTLLVCNPQSGPEALPVGTEITMYTNQPDDGGTFFVTAAVTIGGDPGCSNSASFATVSLQAIAPAKVGTLQSPAGQPYTLAPGDQLNVNVNNSLFPAPPFPQPPSNTYGTGSQSNTCTPAGAPGAVPNNFGASAPPGSSTLNAGTGGVNATYGAC